LGDTFPAFWILISLFFSNHCLAVTRQAVGVMTGLSALLDTSAANS
jgi:hypothetical protein